MAETVYCDDYEQIVGPRSDRKVKAKLVEAKDDRVETTKVARGDSAVAGDN